MDGIIAQVWGESKDVFATSLRQVIREDVK